MHTRRPTRRWFQLGTIEFVVLTSIFGIILVFCAQVPVTLVYRTYDPGLPRPNQYLAHNELRAPRASEVAIRVAGWSGAAAAVWLGARSLIEIEWD